MGHSCAYGHPLPHLHSSVYGHCFLGTLGVRSGTLLCIWAPIVSYSFLCIWALVSTGALCGTLWDTRVHMGHSCAYGTLLCIWAPIASSSFFCIWVLFLREFLRGTLWGTLICIWARIAWSSLFGIWAPFPRESLSGTLPHKQTLNTHIIDISSLCFSDCHPHIARALNTRMIMHILALLQADTLVHMGHTYIVHDLKTHVYCA